MEGALQAQYELSDSFPRARIALEGPVIRLGSVEILRNTEVAVVSAWEI